MGPRRATQLQNQYSCSRVVMVIVRPGYRCEEGGHCYQPGSGPSRPVLRLSTSLSQVLRHKAVLPIFEFMISFQEHFISWQGVIYFLLSHYDESHLFFYGGISFPFQTYVSMFFYILYVTSFYESDLHYIFVLMNNITSLIIALSFVTLISLSGSCFLSLLSGRMSFYIRKYIFFSTDCPVT